MILLQKGAGGMLQNETPENEWDHDVISAQGFREVERPISICAQLKSTIREYLNEVRPQLTLMLDFSTASGQQTDANQIISCGVSLDGSQVYVFSPDSGGFLATVSAIPRGGKLVF